MPGPDSTYEYPEGDLFPQSDNDYKNLQNWCLQAWDAAYRAKQPIEDKWKRFYKLYRAYIKKRSAGDWRSRVFMPEVFQTIETILPRLIAELPKFSVLPHGPEDVGPAQVLQSLIDYASKASGKGYDGLYIELCKTYKDMLLYGTGIVKVYYDELGAFKRVPTPRFSTQTVPVEQPLIDPETQQPMRDPDGNVVMDTQEVSYDMPIGTEFVKQRYVAYDGPVVKAVDPFNFWCAPEATDLDSAGYVIQRTFKPLKEVKRLIAEGIYHLPPGVDLEDDESFWASTEDQPHIARLDSIELGPGNNNWERRQVECFEFWTNDGGASPGRQIVMLNRAHVVRVQENPFDHGQKPYALFYDYPQSHEFWGVGEVEHIEGLQDFINALVNQRMDNVRLGLDQGYVVNSTQLKDPRQLQRKPGQIIEVTGDGMQPQDVVFPLPVTEITQSAFVEAQNAQNMLERTTGVSGLQQGISTESYTETASGISQVLEQGSARFSLKSRFNELGALKRIGRHMGSHIQQFTTAEKVVRLIGPDGLPFFEVIDPSGIQGALDYEIASESIMQSETMKRQQAMDLFGLVAQSVSMMALPPQAATIAFLDVAETFGIKDAAQKFILAQPAAIGMGGQQDPGLGDMSQPGQDLSQQGGMA